MSLHGVCDCTSSPSHRRLPSNWYTKRELLLLHGCSSACKVGRQQAVQHSLWLSKGIACQHTCFVTDVTDCCTCICCCSYKPACKHGSFWRAAVGCRQHFSAWSVCCASSCQSQARGRERGTGCNTWFQRRSAYSLELAKHRRSHAQVCVVLQRDHPCSTCGEQIYTTAQLPLVALTFLSCRLTAVALQRRKNAAA